MKDTSRKVWQRYKDKYKDKAISYSHFIRLVYLYGKDKALKHVLKQLDKTDIKTEFINNFYKKRALDSK